MPWYTTWTKKDESPIAYAEFRPTFSRLQDELRGIGPLLNHQEFMTFGGKGTLGENEYASAVFQLPDSLPSVIAYVEATRWTKTNHTDFLLGMRNFSDPKGKKRFERLEKIASWLGVRHSSDPKENKKMFEKLEEIASRYGFKAQKPFESKT